MKASFSCTNYGLTASVVLSLFFSYPALGGITGVERTGTSANCEPALGGTLIEGSTAYCDESFTWTSFPPEADGVILDYIVVSDADNAVGDYGLSITVDLPGSILLFINPGIDVATDMPWVIDDGYVKEDSINFTLDQGGPAEVYDLWALDVDDTANPVVTGPQSNGDFHNYGVAYGTDAADLAISIVDDPDPYVLDSGVNWTRTYKVENLGQSDMDEIVVSFSGSGVSEDRTFVSREWSPNSTFHQLGQFKWRMQTLANGESATLTVVVILGPNQAVGTNAITMGAQIDSADGFDPDLMNNSAEEKTSVLAVSNAITGVTRIGTSANCAPALGGTLIEGSTAYCDQSYTWTNLPSEADGTLLDYIVVSDADSSVGDYGLSIIVDLPGGLLLFIDPAIDVATDMPWVIDDGYIKEEGLNFTLDQGGPADVFDLWVLDIDDPADPIVTGPQNNGVFHNYGVAYATDAADLEISMVDDPDPYVLGSGAHWTRVWTVKNLGPHDTGNIIMSGSAPGLTPGFTPVSLETSPNSNFNVEVPDQWHIPMLDPGESATLTYVIILSPDQAVGTDVITTNAQIDSSDMFDPDLTNNSATETTTVLSASDGDVITKDGFEDP